MTSPLADLVEKTAFNYLPLKFGKISLFVNFCWEHNDRDFNSAKNILKEGLRIRTSGTEGIAYCPDVRPALSGLLV